MSLIEKFFPYSSLFHFDGNTLTAWWVLITLLLFFIIPIIILIKSTGKLKKALVKLARNFDEDSINKNELLKNVWVEYSETFIDLFGTKKTDEFSVDFFNENNLLLSNTNLKLLTYIPAALVGFGILGTFVGLTLGVSNFNTETTDAIKNSIEVLLSGMGTAFVSSIWGMGLSLIYSVAEKFYMHSLHNSLHNLCNKLDKKYKVSKDDERTLEATKQREIIAEYFIFIDENNNKVKPANIFRDLYNESVKQSKALQAFSTDLALKIETGFETIMSNQIQKGVIPELQSLRAEIQVLGEKIQSPTTEMTQTVVKDLEKALGGMMNEFRNSISGSTNAELEKIAGLLGEAGNSLNDFPLKLQLMTENLNSNFASLQDIVKQISNQTLEQSFETTERMKKQIEDMSNTLNGKIGELQINHEVLINEQTSNLKVSESLLKAFDLSIGKMNSLSEGITSSIAGFSKVNDGLNSAVFQLRQISDNVLKSTLGFNKSQDEFSQYSQQFLESNGEILEEIQNSLRIAKDLSTDYVNKFNTIEEGLKSIFDQIQIGLNDYGNTVGRSMEETLGKYTGALTTSCESLSNATSMIEESIEGLTEQLTKLNGDRK